MRVLWLTSWYPNRTEMFTGDFIQRHARAVSLYHEVQVVHIVRDATGNITKDVLEEENSDGRLKEKIIYYYSRRIPIPFLNKINSQLKYRRLYKQYIRSYVKENGKPALVHVHVGMKAGVIARWIKQKMNIPFVITEHWTGFLPEAKPQITDKPYYWQKTWSKLLSEAAGVSAVSLYLAENLKKFVKKEMQVQIIPNVVDTEIFFPARNESDETMKFIHVSNLEFQKNAEDILRAFAIVKKTTSFFSLDIFGSVKYKLVDLSKQLLLTDHVSFHEEIVQSELAKHMQQSKCLILYSRYETFGCVVIEANACGIPVIVSDIPVMHELVKDHKNGLIVKGNDPQALAETILWFIKNHKEFNAGSIADASNRHYNYSVIGKQFSEWYELVLKND